MSAEQQQIPVEQVSAEEQQQAAPVAGSCPASKPVAQAPAANNAEAPAAEQSEDGQGAQEAAAE